MAGFSLATRTTMSGREEETEVHESVTRRPIRNAVKRSYIEYVEANGATAYSAWKHFKAAHPKVRASQVHQWLEKKEAIRKKPSAMRSSGGGRKPLSENLEDLLFEFIFSKRMRKEQVKRSLIKHKALQLAEELDVLNFKASDEIGRAHV